MKTILGIAIGLCLACSTCIVEGAPKHLSVIWADSPQTKAIVSWSTDKEEGPHTVYYDTAPRGADVEKYASQVKPEKDFKFAAGPKSEIELYGHHAVVDGLKADTRVYFVVKAGDLRLT